MTVAPLLTPTDRVAFIVKGLRDVVADKGGRRLITGALVLLIWNRLGRIGEKFAALAERVRAGTLPAPAPVRTRTVSVSASASPRLERPKPETEMPTGFAWLIRLGGYHAAGFGCQLQHLLSDPEMVALIAAAPRQMGRSCARFAGCWGSSRLPACSRSALANRGLPSPPALPARQKLRRRPPRSRRRGVAAARFGRAR